MASFINMRSFCTLVIILLLFSGCSSQKLYEQNVLLEKPTNIIVEESSREAYTGSLTARSEDGVVFQGNVKNGKPHGLCYWVRNDADTIQILQFAEGEKIYSCQFNSKGERSAIWIKYAPQIDEQDSSLIKLVLNTIKRKDYGKLDEMIQSGALDYPAILERELKGFIAVHGELNDFSIQEINKSSYNFRNDEYLELIVLGLFQHNTLKMGVRILEDKGNIQSVSIWEYKDSNVDRSSLYYESLSIWTYLNI